MSTKVSEADEKLTKIMYKGEPVVIEETGKDKTFYFNHMNEYDMWNKISSHACLKYGFWCWRNVLEEPRDVVLYIRKKLRDALRRL